MTEASFKEKLGVVAKTDNAPRSAKNKIAIRRMVLDAIPEPRVFDAFAGAGHMHDAVWCDALAYVGCDRVFFNDSRIAYVADNTRVMRCIDLAAFSIYDFDAYGSPWEQIYILAHRRPIAPGERIGMVITEGQGLKLKMGGMSHALRTLSGIPPHPGLSRMQDEIISRAILRTADMMQARIVNHWQHKGKLGSAMRYIGLVLEGIET